MSTWRTAIEAHTRFAVRIYSADEMARLSKAAGIPIDAEGAVVAYREDDATRYVDAVKSVLGEVAGISAHLQISTKIRQLRLK